MSGKRLLDAVAVLNASRAVASKHFSIRRSQLELYASTSSLTKTLSRRTGDDRQGHPTSNQSFSQSAPPANAQSDKHSVLPSALSVEGQGKSAKDSGGVEQDHHYDRSQENSITDSVPDHDLDIQQETAKRYPLPDGTIPHEHSEVHQQNQDHYIFNQRPVGEPIKRSLARSETGEQPTLHTATSARSTILDPSTDPHDLSAHDAKVLQRQSESQIPSQPASPPPIEEESGFGVEQEQDVFYQPPNSTSPVLSALPRLKVPKSTEDIQGGDPHVPQKLNADVFYSSKKLSAKDLADQTGSAEQEPSDEALSSLFYSPRTARLLGLKSKQVPGGLKPPGSRTMTTSNGRFVPKNATESDQESLKQLAADMAKDAESQQNLSRNAGSMNRKVTYEMRESRVPSSQIGRLWQFGGLAASMAFGAVGDRFNGSPSNSSENGSFMLSAGNMDRLVAKLSKMRGAALKLGQMMSFQDSKMLPKPVHEVLQRVQDSADYMPPAQRNAVLAADLGNDWRELFETFEEKPMAAASIGQVHGAVLRSTGQRVAVKVQYPGVASSISSDLNNLSLLLTASRMLPKGLYLDKTIANARTELAWECDYVREAECAKRFSVLLADDSDTFAVPTIIDDASGKQVLTMEKMEGTAVTKMRNPTQEQSDWIGTQILRLCLREIVEFNFMQTDPNWTNFLYNAKTSKLELLDFGASREFPREFMNLYVQNLVAASKKDREACRDLSIQLGYLTGYESKAMLNAHIDSVMTLAEPFMSSAPEVYNFKDQTITDRVRALIPIMIRERLAPPPEETYSLHRKLSGAFLLCARLGSRVRCKDMFVQAVAKSGIA